MRISCGMILFSYLCQQPYDCDIFCQVQHVLYTSRRGPQPSQVHSTMFSNSSDVVLSILQEYCQRDKDQVRDKQQAGNSKFSRKTWCSQRRIMEKEQGCYMKEHCSSRRVQNWLMWSVTALLSKQQPDIFFYKTIELLYCMFCK